MPAIGTLTFLDFSESDFEPAQEWCARLGYGNSYAYCTGSDIPGLYCLPRSADQKTTVICKTAEYGLISIQTLEE